MTDYNRAGSTSIIISLALNFLTKVKVIPTASRYIWIFRSSKLYWSNCKHYCINASSKSAIYPESSYKLTRAISRCVQSLDRAFSAIIFWYESNLSSVICSLNFTPARLPHTYCLDWLFNESKSYSVIRPVLACTSTSTLVANCFRSALDPAKNGITYSRIKYQVSESWFVLWTMNY